MGFGRWRYVLPLRLRSLFRSATADRELDEELRYHIERQTELNIGLAVGLPLAVVAMRGTGTLLFGLSPTSARGMVEAMSLLAAAGLVAAAVPAWRAARIRLDEALRCE
jgi:hypothetical protein